MAKSPINSYSDVRKVLVGAVVICCYAFPAGILAQTFDHDLYYGLQNSQDVTKLQDFLTSENLYSGPISGNYYSLTQTPVRAFQLREDILPPRGFFSPNTPIPPT